MNTINNQQHMHILQTFVDSPNMKVAILKKNQPIFSIICFVSFNQSGVVCVVIGGTCNSCGAHHLRNMCNIRYCDEVITPILRNMYKFVTAVKPVLTVDMDFEAVISSVGAKCVSTPPDYLMTKWDHRKQILDYHPLIDCALKQTSVYPSVTDCADDHQMTRADLVSNFEFFWYVDETMSLLSIEGKLLKGEEQILEGAMNNVLPAGFDMIAIGVRREIVIRCTNSHELLHDKFIQIIME